MTDIDAVLKPCPFDGADAVLVETITEDLFHVQCERHDCQLGYGTQVKFSTAEKAIGAWNTRADLVVSPLLDKTSAVVKFVATTRVLFAHHTNEEGNYLRCLRCNGESSYHGRDLTPVDVAHARGCPVAIAVEILANPSATGSLGIAKTANFAEAADWAIECADWIVRSQLSGITKLPLDECLKLMTMPIARIITRAAKKGAFNG